LLFPFLTLPVRVLARPNADSNSSRFPAGDEGLRNGIR